MEIKLNREQELSICTILRLKTIRTVARKVVREILSMKRKTVGGFHTECV